MSCSKNDGAEAAPTGQASSFEGLIQALRADPEIGPRMKAIDEVEAEVAGVLEFVDLDIEYSPVLMHAGDTMADAKDVAYKAEGGKYVFDNPLKVVTAAELKVMRGRFLVTRGREMTAQIRAPRPSGFGF